MLFWLFGGHTALRRGQQVEVEMSCLLIFGSSEREALNEPKWDFVSFSRMRGGGAPHIPIPLCDLLLYEFISLPGSKQQSSPSLKKSPLQLFSPHSRRPSQSLSVWQSPLQNSR